VDSLLKLLKRAESEEPELQEGFNEQSSGHTPEQMEEWTRLETIAMEQRGEALKVYDVEADLGQYIPIATNEVLMDQF
jgi:hypothetical protein